MRAIATTFTGVAHRLQIVREHRGVTWVNDSIATAPERAMAGLRAFDGPIVLLAGGRDKKLPWDTWAALVNERAAFVVLFGEAGDDRRLLKLAADLHDRRHAVIIEGEGRDARKRLLFQKAQHRNVEAALA